MSLPDSGPLLKSATLLNFHACLKKLKTLWCLRCVVNEWKDYPSQQSMKSANGPAMKIEIPNTSRGNHIVFVRGIFYACYKVDGKTKRKSLETPHFKDALVERDKFYATLTATTQAPRTPAEKVAANGKRYVHKRPSFGVVVEKKFLGYHKTRALAEAARDAYIATL